LRDDLFELDSFEILTHEDLHLGWFISSMWLFNLQKKNVFYMAETSEQSYLIINLHYRICKLKDFFDIKSDWLVSIQVKTGNNFEFACLCCIQLFLANFFFIFSWILTVIALIVILTLCFLNQIMTSLNIRLLFWVCALKEATE